MDLLYSRYASPWELMNIYIEQGRFGEFVSEILELEHKRKQEESEKESENRLWLAYVHSYTDKSFNEWKVGLFSKEKPEGYSMTDAQVANVKEQAKGILKNISPV